MAICRGKVFSFKAVIFAFMKAYDVTLLTCPAYHRPTEITDYINNVLTEDRLIAEALQAKGLKVYRTSWDDPAFDWASTEVAIFRTTWDYFHRAAEFAAWLNKVQHLTRLINPIDTIRWNMDKHYLQDLAHKGVPTVPTIFIEPGEQRSLKQIAEHSGWQQFIIKPAISGGARHTYKFALARVADYEQVFKQLIATESMLLQPFMERVESHGEVSHMVFGGRYSHSVHKKAKAGDFRVQDDFGGTVHHYQASANEVAFAEAVAAHCKPIPVYARVDVMWDNQNQLALVELEAIEPELWMRKHPTAATMFAQAVVATF